jgi:hypothetical protein
MKVNLSWSTPLFRHRACLRLYLHGMTRETHTNSDDLPRSPSQLNQGWVRRECDCLVSSGQSQGRKPGLQWVTCGHSGYLYCLFYHLALVPIPQAQPCNQLSTADTWAQPLHLSLFLLPSKLPGLQLPEIESDEVGDSFIYLMGMKPSFWSG